MRHVQNLIFRGFLLIQLLALPFSSAAWSHDAGGSFSQYSRLSADLVKKIRDRDANRTAAQIHGFEAASAADGDKKQAIISQFGLGGAGPTSFEQIYIKNTLWPVGHRFRICFFDGDGAARNHVLDLLEAIAKETNLKVDRTDRNCPDARADIQVRFDERDCYSYYGKDSLDIIKENVNFTTMALCHLAGPTWTPRDDGTIRHEIMHALGAAHEHQHPDSKCKDEFNLDAFRNPPLFDADPAKNEQAITVNIAEITKSYTLAELEIVKYDPKSVMHYRLPARFFKTPNATCILAADNNVLSESDWAFLKKMYPKN
jgi:Astacin (Peptidase family M12A)